ncbi:hypothetical protein M153_3400026387 [Pseudoloma neurophilia]|uniref:Uncharacterized protein n=1 Tax=Pseudoloma neurophilia TaxID=146866 RepID=A0A0R0M0N5_9MICR|nr:hypothetical protein M153_3400026387 [Pseudoloma neurophilia]
MILIVFLLFILVLRTQNEEIRTEDFMNFLNPIDSQENRKAQNLDLFIEQYLNFNEENLQESDKHANIQVQQQNNVSSDLFCEILCDSSFMNVESTQSTSLFDPTSDQQLLYDEIESIFECTSLEVSNPTIGASGCQCVGLCLCITNTKLDMNPLDIDSTCHINSDIFLSEILFSNEQNQQDDIKNINISQSEPCQIQCEVEANLNSTEQSTKQQVYPDKKEKFSSSMQIDNIILPSYISYNPKLPKHIEKLYLDHENKITGGSRVKTNFEEKNQAILCTVQPSTSQEIVISGVKNTKKRKYSDESNETAIRKYRNAESIEEESNSSFNSGGSKTCSNASENELLVNQATIIYDPRSQENIKELEVHLKNCDYYAHPEMKRLIVQIYYEQSLVKRIKYEKINIYANIRKTEKSKEKLHLFGTYITYPSKGGSSFTVRIPKMFENENQIKSSNYPLVSVFVPITTADEYNLTLIMSCYNKTKKQPSAYFITDNVAEYIPSHFYAYHFKQVIRFEMNRQVNDRVFYHFEYKPEKEV